MECITVIVPVYNVEKYLPRCLDSILYQSYTNLEIVLVDDGSTDRTMDICKQYAVKDKRISVFCNTSKGISAARNMGIHVSVGKYIVMVDGDDYISPYMIQTLYTALMEKNADLAVCDFIRGTQENYLFTAFNKSVEQIDAVTALHCIYKRDHDKLRWVVPWAKLYKRELFEGITYPEGKIFEDVYTTHKILNRCASIAVVDEIMTYYFQRSDSIMNRSFHLQKLDYLDGLKERIEFFRDYDLADLEKNAYDELLHMLIWEYSRVRDILHDPDTMKSIVQTFRTYYKKGYVSSYPSDTKFLLRLFYINPELVVFYWKISAKLNLLLKRRSE